MKIAACAIARNAERLLPEWLAWYHVQGFDCCIVLDHNSTDETSHIAERYALRQDVRLHRLSLSRGIGSRGQAAQPGSYDAVCQLYAGEFDWIGMFDCDEMLLVPGGVRQWLRRFDPGVAQVSARWAMFGSNGHVVRPPGLMIENYLRRAAPDWHACLMGKSLVRPEKLDHWPNPHAAYVDGRTVDAEGDDAQWSVHVGRHAEPRDYISARTNHYFTRSWEDWQERLTTSSAFHGADMINHRTVEMFHESDRGECVDTAASEFAPLLRAHMANIAPPAWRSQWR